VECVAGRAPGVVAERWPQVGHDPTLLPRLSSAKAPHPPALSHFPAPGRRGNNLTSLKVLSTDLYHERTRKLRPTLKDAAVCVGRPSFATGGRERKLRAAVQDLGFSQERLAKGRQLGAAAGLLLVLRGCCGAERP
jgi:hypothetical protein